jgi:hypothetical protein
METAGSWSAFLVVSRFSLPIRVKIFNLVTISQELVNLAPFVLDDGSIVTGERHRPTNLHHRLLNVLFIVGTKSSESIVMNSMTGATFVYFQCNVIYSP